MTDSARIPRVERAELDALLGGAPSATPSVEPRDFGRPRRLSGDRRERLSRAMRGTIPELEAQLGHMLRRPVRVELAAIGELSIEGHFASVPDPLAVLCFGAGGHPAWIQWEPAAASSAVEILLGAADPRPADRSLTSIERSVLERILRVPAERLCAGLGLAAGNFRVPAKREQLGTWRDAGERADPHRVSFEVLVEIGDVRSTLRVYLPTNEFLESDAKEDFHWPANKSVPIHLSDVPVEISVQLGHTDILFRDLQLLEVGDVVPLDRRTDEPVLLRADEQIFGLGKLGSRKGQLAVRISEVLMGKEHN